MKLKIKVKVLTEGCMPKLNKKGDWIDLRAAQDVELRAAQSGTLKQENNGKYRNITIPVTYIPLGVAIQLPKGFEAIVASRSGSPKKLKLFIPSGIGVIDNSYCGDSDMWKYPVYAMRDTEIHVNDRICQFRIIRNQPTIEFEEVDHLDGKDGGGFGSSGVQ